MFKYTTKQVKVLGMEVIVVTLLKDGVKVAASQFNSLGLCAQWAANEAKKLCK